MKRIIYVISVAACLASCNDDALVSENKTPSHAEQTEREEAKGELFIKFDPEMTDILDQIAEQANSRAGASRSGIPSTDEVLSILGAYSLQRVFPIDEKSEARTREAGLHLWYRVRFDESIDTETAKEQLKALGEVSAVQGNPIIKRSYRTDVKTTFFSEKALASRSTTTDAYSYPFNDKYLPDQWGYINVGDYDFDHDRTDGIHSIAGADVNCKEAWKLCTGDPSVIVAVLDEGVMYNHPDLAANMWVNESETLASNTDADGNGYKGDRYGYNFVRDSGDISFNSGDDTGHATHVAGTIAAVNNNNIGVCGIAGGDGTPNSGVKIMSCQIFDGSTTATLWGEARAIKYAADNGAVIIQCSWGYNSALSNPIYGYTPGYATEKEWVTAFPLEKECIDYFIHNAGSPNGVLEGGLAIFASGNEYAGMSAFPAAYSECISVSAISADFTPSSYSNFGTEVALSAPGGDSDYHGKLGVKDDDLGTQQQGMILSTLAKGNEAGYGYYEGTSMACPHVSGVAALGLSYAMKLHKHFKAADFKKLLTATACDLDQYYTGKKTYHYNHSSQGSSLTVLNLTEYRGKMGKLVDAGALLKQIAADGNGVPMKLPNAYLAPGKTVKLALSQYFDGGSSLSYTGSVASTDVATLSISGTVLSITGVNVGATTATIKGSNGKEQTIVITVRKGATNGGWM